MTPFAKQLLLGTVILLASQGMLCAAETPRSAAAKGLAWQWQEDGGPCLVWQSRSGRQVRLHGLHAALTDPQAGATWSLKVEPAERKINEKSATLVYRVTLDDGRRPLIGSARLDVTLSDKSDEDALSCRSDLKFERPVGVDLGVEYVFELSGPSPHAVIVPERRGMALTEPLRPGMAQSGKFRLGMGSDDAAGHDLGMPVLGISWDEADGKADPLQLAVATDPYCGCSITAAARPGPAPFPSCVTVSTTYHASIVPLTDEKRPLSLEFHRHGADGTFCSFYRTIPEIAPGPPWTQGIHLVYYDYLSENGEGWFRDLRTLADKIPPQRRGHVAVCLHGWYDYFQRYAYDQQQKKLLKQWTAFPGTRKIPMSLEGMHKRLAFARSLGFHTLLYFADGTNSDSGAPNFRTDYVLKDQLGRTTRGWKGPDSLGEPLRMDPSVPGLRNWYRDFLAALLDEYAKDIDGLVWDETCYIPAEFVSYTSTTPAYADRAMMRLVADLTQMVQQRRQQNPDLVFLASDCGMTNYALVAHGTYQDSACMATEWGPSMFANYRNCLWSCNWVPVSLPRNNENAAEQFGLPQGLSNGWEDSQGPHAMPPALLDQILERFNKNVESQRQRLRYLSLDAARTIGPSRALGK